MSYEQDYSRMAEYIARARFELMEAHDRQLFEAEPGTVEAVLEVIRNERDAYEVHWDAQLASVGGYAERTIWHPAHLTNWYAVVCYRNGVLERINYVNGGSEVYRQGVTP